jgi:hypothetical protein
MLVDGVQCGGIRGRSVINKQQFEGQRKIDFAASQAA